MFGPDSGSGSWHGLNFMFEQVRVSSGASRQKRVDAFLQASVQGFRQAGQPQISFFKAPETCTCRTNVTCMPSQLHALSFPYH